MSAHDASPPSARERLLQAAAVVFARDGLGGATTRAIAQEAGVNEVTLFRHFQSKDRLLAAVVGEKFGQAAAANQAKVPPVTADLRADLLALAGAYDSMLTASWPLVRAMLGEMHHHLNESSERQVVRAILQPLKAALLARIESAQAAGELRRDSRPDVLADLFFGAIFYGVLRRSMPHVRLEYSVATYLESAVSMFLDGAAKA